MRSIDEILPDVMEEIDTRFRERSVDWDLARRNRAITGRNRNMRKIAEMLGMEYRELPLEAPETA